MSGIIAAVRGMLSTIAEAMAANQVTMNIASPVESTFSIMIAAMLDGHDLDDQSLVLNPIEHAVLAPAR